MAPPDQTKNKPNGHGMGDGDGDDDQRAHPCEGSGSGGGDGSASAVDQDHKACDEHTQGEPVSLVLSLVCITPSTAHDRYLRFCKTAQFLDVGKCPLPLYSS